MIEKGPDIYNKLYTLIYLGERNDTGMKMIKNFYFSTLYFCIVLGFLFFLMQGA